MSEWYKLNPDKTISPITIDELVNQRIYDSDNKVAYTNITKDIYVSTVFLVLDHSFGEGPPLVFETMIFGGELDQYQERYSTYQQAEAGHLKACREARKALPLGTPQTYEPLL